MSVRSLNRCVKANNGKTYCWDDEQNCFVEVLVKEVKPEELPKDALIAMMEEKAT